MATSANTCSFSNCGVISVFPSNTRCLTPLSNAAMALGGSSGIAIDLAAAGVGGRRRRRDESEYSQSRNLYSRRAGTSLMRRRQSLRWDDFSLYCSCSCGAAALLPRPRLLCVSLLAAAAAIVCVIASLCAPLRYTPHRRTLSLGRPSSSSSPLPAIYTSWSPLRVVLVPANRCSQYVSLVARASSMAPTRTRERQS